MIAIHLTVVSFTAIALMTFGLTAAIPQALNQLNASSSTPDVVSIEGVPEPDAPAEAVGLDFTVDWYTIDGGGGTSTSGAFALSGTIGQPDASGAMTGGDYSLIGGFWTAQTDPGTTCPSDLNGDSQINVFDMLALLGDWGDCGRCGTDLNGDGTVNVLDLLILLSAWGSCQ